jgi:hypothetical protein
MALSNKRKSMKKLNKNKLKKSKKNRLKNKYIGGNNNNDKKYKEINYVNIKSFNDFSEHYEDPDPEKNRNIIEELTNKKNTLPINNEAIYYLGSPGQSMTFTKGKYLKTTLKELQKSEENIYLVDPQLVSELIKDSFLPEEYKSI